MELQDKKCSVIFVCPSAPVTLLQLLIWLWMQLSFLQGSSSEPSVSVTAGVRVQCCLWPQVPALRAQGFWLGSEGLRCFICRERGGSCSLSRRSIFRAVCGIKWNLQVESLALCKYEVHCSFHPPIFPSTYVSIHPSISELVVPWLHRVKNLSYMYLFSFALILLCSRDVETLVVNVGHSAVGSQPICLRTNHCLSSSQGAPVSVSEVLRGRNKTWRPFFPNRFTSNLRKT